MLALALALLAQEAPRTTTAIASSEPISTLESECLKQHGENDEAALMACLGNIDPRHAPIHEVEAAIHRQHPSQLLVFAARLLQSEDRPDDALFWFYAGQLRWRAQLSCDPPQPGGEGAAFGALVATIGHSINTHAASNVDNWIATIDRVLRWDEATANPLLPDGCDAAREEQRESLLQLAGSIDQRRGDFEAAARDREAQTGVN